MNGGKFPISIRAPPASIIDSAVGQVAGTLRVIRVMRVWALYNPSQASSMCCRSGSSKQNWRSSFEVMDGPPLDPSGPPTQKKTEER